MIAKTKAVKVSDLHLNNGQINGVPKNPRYIKDDRFAALVKSIQEAPEMLELRECVAYDNNGELVVIMGNMRLRAMREAGIKETVVKVLPTSTPVEKLREYTIKDNISFGSVDWDCLANDGWEVEDLQGWGLECSFLTDEGGDWDNLDYIEDEQKKPNLDKPLKIEVIVPVEIKEQEEEIKDAIKEAIANFEGCEVK